MSQGRCEARRFVPIGDQDRRFEAPIGQLTNNCQRKRWKKRLATANTTIMGFTNEIGQKLLPESITAKRGSAPSAPFRRSTLEGTDSLDSVSYDKARRPVEPTTISVRLQ
jgi:hypothetical protein